MNASGLFVGVCSVCVIYCALQHVFRKDTFYNDEPRCCRSATGAWKCKKIFRISRDKRLLAQKLPSNLAELRR